MIELMTKNTEIISKLSDSAGRQALLLAVALIVIGFIVFLYYNYRGQTPVVDEEARIQAEMIERQKEELDELRTTHGSAQLFTQEEIDNQLEELNTLRSQSY